MAIVGTGAWRKEFWGEGCDRKVIIADYWALGAGKIQCHRNTMRVWRAVGRIMRKHRYAIRSDVTGAYNCRKITGGTSLSAHAQGIALDVNWDTNPYRLDKLVTDMPQAMIDEIEALETLNNVKAVRWGGDWDGRPETPNSNYDSMHFETICTPLDVKFGFSIAPFAENDKWSWPLLALNEKGGAVTQLQLYLSQEFPIEQDGYFGEKTQAAVRAYQATRGLEADGVVGLGTWTSLITRQPRWRAGQPLPSKSQVA